MQVTHELSPGCMERTVRSIVPKHLRCWQRGGSRSRCPDTTQNPDKQAASMLPRAARPHVPTQGLARCSCTRCSGRTASPQARFPSETRSVPPGLPSRLSTSSEAVVAQGQTVLWGQQKERRLLQRCWSRRWPPCKQPGLGPAPLQKLLPQDGDRRAKLLELAEGQGRSLPSCSSLAHTAGGMDPCS